MRNHTFGHALKEDSNQPEHQLSDQSLMSASLAIQNTRSEDSDQTL